MAMLRPYFNPLVIAPLMLVAACSAGELQPVALPAPHTDAGKPLMSALRLRQSGREFSGEKLPLEVLSDLLWAASGVNRPESGKRTAPTASNRQELDVYVATSDGLYLYEAKEHRLQPVLSEDIRAQTGTQAFAGQAPVNLVYVADFARMGSDPLEDKIFYSACDTGFVSQNVYLYSASEGLATVVRGGVDRSALAKVMKLRKDQRITLAQSVGYPKK